ncbi:MAG TPA: 30S ribosomal protein S18 [Candidatus Binatia bacterium]|jgi:small subunit ribosomal protein S18
MSEGEDRRDRDRDDKGGGGARERKPRGRFGRSRGRRRVCRFCAEKSLPLDYKWSEVLETFVSERGRIVPSRTTGTCAKHQRSLTVAIKRARNVALLPYAAS